MPITKITAPSATPAAIADYTAQNNLAAALALAAQGAARVSGSNVLKGAVFLVGGAIYKADANTAISGSASDYVKLTISGDGLTLAPSFVADLTGVTWSDTWNGYYDASGNLYEFDELKALAGAAIAAVNLRAISSKNLGAGWATALTAALGTNWATKLAAATVIEEGTAAGDYRIPGYGGCEEIPFIYTSYTKVAEFKCPKATTIRVKFHLKATDGTHYAYGRVYKNGSAFGTEANSGVTIEYTFHEDLAFAKDDLIQLYVKVANASYPGYIRNFELCRNGYGLYVIGSWAAV